MDPNQIDELLFGIGLAGQILLLVILLRRRLYRSFPIFCFYILYASISDIGFWFFLRHASDKSYAMAYFADNVCEFLLQFGILVEVGWNVLNPVRRSLPRASLVVFFGMLVIGTAIPVVIASNFPLARADRWANYFLVVSFVVSILRVAIFAVIAGFSQLLGVGWKNHVLQIATGLLAYSVATLLVEMLHRYTGTGNMAVFRLHEQLRMIVWCMVLGYWSYSLSRVEAVRKEFSPKMAEFLVSISQATRHDRTASTRGYRK
jgi:hypothetical protein